MQLSAYGQRALGAVLALHCLTMGLASMCVFVCVCVCVCVSLWGQIVSAIAWLQVVPMQ